MTLGGVSRESGQRPGASCLTVPFICLLLPPFLQFPHVRQLLPVTPAVYQLSRIRRSGKEPETRISRLAPERPDVAARLPGRLPLTPAPGWCAPPIPARIRFPRCAGSRVGHQRTQGTLPEVALCVSHGFPPRFAVLVRKRPIIHPAPCSNVADSPLLRRRLNGRLSE